MTENVIRLFLKKLNMILHRDFVVYYPSILRVVGLEKNDLIAVGAAFVAIAFSYAIGLPIRKYVPALAGKIS